MLHKKIDVNQRQREMTWYQMYDRFVQGIPLDPNRRLLTNLGSLWVVWIRKTALKSVINLMVHGNGSNFSSFNNRHCYEFLRSQIHNCKNILFLFND